MRRFVYLALTCCLLPLAAPAASPAEAPETRYLARPAGRIAYDDTGGSGPLVVALPGMGDLRAQYRYLRPLLVQAGYRVVTVDVRGHGESSAEWPDYSARAVGDDALALIHHLGRDKAYLVGNSFAAGAALWAAKAQPEAVPGIVMLGPILRDQPVNPLLRGLVWLGFAGPWRTAFWMHYWDSLFPLRKPDDHAAYRERLAAKLRENGRMEALRTMVGLSKAETEAQVDRRLPPTLVVMGCSDPDFSDPLVEAAWLSGRTGAQVVLVGGAGHYPHIEAPARVAADIARFLNSLQAR